MTDQQPNDNFSHEDDELINALKYTKPRASQAHRDELEQQVLDQLSRNQHDNTYSENGRYKQPMQMQSVYPRNLQENSRRQFPVVLVASVTLILFASLLLMLSGGFGANGTNNGDSGAASSGAVQDPTMLPTIPQDFDPDSEPVGIENAAQIIVALDTVTVYADDDEESEVLGELDKWSARPFIGANQDGEWFVIEWDDEIVGWIMFENVKFFIDPVLFDNDPVQIDVSATPASESTPFPPTAVPPESTSTTTE